MSTSNFLLLIAAFICCRGPMVSAGGSLRGAHAANGTQAAESSGTGHSAARARAGKGHLGAAKGAERRSAHKVHKKKLSAQHKRMDERFFDTTNGTADMAQCPDRPRLFIGIPSAPREAERRLTVRSTWMQYKVLKVLKCVEAKFFVGGHEMTPAARTLVQWEADKYNDVVLLPMKDAYDVLPNKTLTIMQWVAANSHADWFMKLDDDSFPHLENVMRYLQGYGLPRYAYSGSFLWDHPVLHDGKWAEKSDYKEDKYPPYAVGAGYMLSHKLVKRFVREVYYNATSRHDLLHNEDCQVGVWIDRMQDKHLVQLKDVKASMWGCQTGDLISMQLSVHVMKCMWRFKTSRMPVHDDHICCAGS
mmetsp:Transcript_50084/g.88283  ORF Transcript_50084/g.88283 Transcript_50084/m.88283 type:complete len:361 (-) Transcript_50084:99-1181(-)